MGNKKVQPESFAGKKVHIVVDRPIGYNHKGIIYPVNYGYIPGVTPPPFYIFYQIGGIRARRVRARCQIFTFPLQSVFSSCIIPKKQRMVARWRPLFVPAVFPVRRNVFAGNALVSRTVRAGAAVSSSIYAEKP